MDAKAENIRKITKLPIWQLIIGAIVLFGTSCYAIRIVWEQTVWSWERGPQMIGFSLIHGYNFFLVFFPWLTLLWLPVVCVNIIYRLIKKLKVNLVTWIMVSYSIFLVVLISLPYGFWQRLFIEKYSRKHSVEFFIYAASFGDLKTLKAFHEKGVMINDSNRDGITALHAAAVNGHNEVIQYLLSEGANKNMINKFGNTPLENAREMKHPETVKLLSKHSSN